VKSGGTTGDGRQIKGRKRWAMGLREEAGVVKRGGVKRGGVKCEGRRAR
jgi:hypothetical protein